MFPTVGSIDSRVNLNEDPFLRPLIVADFERMQEQVKVDIEDNYWVALSILSIIGHIFQNHIKGAMRFLADNFAQLKRQYKISLPSGVHEIDEYNQLYIGGNANLTPYHVVQILYEHRVVQFTPEELFDFCQSAINGYRDRLLNLDSPRGNGHQLFGIRDEPDCSDRYAFKSATLSALGIMDTPEWRAHYNKKLGFGIIIIKSWVLGLIVQLIYLH